MIYFKFRYTPKIHDGIYDAKDQLCFVLQPRCRVPCGEIKTEIFEFLDNYFIGDGCLSIQSVWKLTVKPSDPYNLGNKVRRWWHHHKTGGRIFINKADLSGWECFVGATDSKDTFEDIEVDLSDSQTIGNAIARLANEQGMAVTPLQVELRLLDEFFKKAKCSRLWHPDAKKFPEFIAKGDIIEPRIRSAEAVTLQKMGYIRQVAALGTQHPNDGPSPHIRTYCGAEISDKTAAIEITEEGRNIIMNGKNQKLIYNQFNHVTHGDVNNATGGNNVHTGRRETKVGLVQSEVAVSSHGNSSYGEKKTNFFRRIVGFLGRVAVKMFLFFAN